MSTVYFLFAFLRFSSFDDGDAKKSDTEDAFLTHAQKGTNTFKTNLTRVEKPASIMHQLHN